MNLNYEAIEKVANRDYIRKNFKTSSKVAYWISYKEISVREGFNEREDYSEIEELAVSIFEHGLLEPFVLDVLPTGLNYIVEGHRRHRAISLLISEGKVKEDAVFQFFHTASDVTELSRKAGQIISNNFQKKFNTIEMSKVAWSIKNDFSEQPKSHEEVAKTLALSRQTIDNLIAIHEAPDDIRNEIRLGTLSINKALELIRSQRKLKKQTDAAEEKSHETGMYVSGTKDELAGEMKELKELEETPIPKEETEEEKSQRELREQTKRQQAREQLLEVSDEINVSSGTLEQHIGKKLSADVLATWVDNFLDEDTGELIPVDRKKVVVYKGNILTEEIAADILAEKVDTIFVYKKGKEPIAESFITEPIAQKEKDKYDLGRPEIAQVQNVIKLLDRLDMLTQKFGIPDGSKKDVADIVKWCHKDLEELRTWIHSNKKQNKK